MQDSSTMPAAPPVYPVRLSMRYPQRLSRLSAAFRLILALPVMFFLALLTGGSLQWAAGAAGGVLIAIWAAIIVRERIPHWLFDFQVGVHRFTYRAYAYLGLLTDRYPPFEGDWDLQYQVDYPDRISRWRVLFWKLIASLPHVIVLFFLNIAAFFVVFIAWWAILFTGQFPRGLHRFVVGVLRWNARVRAYFESMTDAFPPYSLDEDAGPGGGQAVSAVVGGVLLAGLIAGAVGIGVAAWTVTHKTETVHVAYSDVTAGRLRAADAGREFDNVAFVLNRGSDPASSDLAPVLEARAGYRLVEFDLTYRDGHRFRPRAGDKVDARTVRIETADEGVLRPVLLTIDGTATPFDVDDGAPHELRAIFEVGEGDTIQEVRAYPLVTSGRHVAWVFR